VATFWKLCHSEDLETFSLPYDDDPLQVPGVYCHWCGTN